MKNALLALLLFFFTGMASAHAQTPTLTLDHAAICVRDLKASTTFYTTVLGLQEIPNPFNDGRHTWLRIGPALQLHIIQGDCSLTPEKNVHLCFRTPSIENFMARLTKATIEFSNVKGDRNTTNTRIDGVKQLYLQDPDGYWIEINDAK